MGDADLEDYVARRHPRQIRGRGRDAAASPAWSAGRKAGRHLVVRQPISSAVPKSRGRLLRG
jgi:hypothetical protein